MKARNVALALGTAAVSGYYVWSRGGRITPEEVGPLYVEAAMEYGDDCGQGNMVGIQPYMVPHDYASRESFYAKLNGYMMEALKRDWLTPKTVVVLPEFVGTWLVLQGEKLDAFATNSSHGAMKLVVLANLPSFIRHLPGATAEDPVRYGLFRMKAAGMAATYDSVFSRLAREYGVTVVAGSIVLPAPEIVDGHLRIADGARLPNAASPLYNVSVVYRPDGTAHEPLVRKAYPTPDETPFIAAGSEADLPVFDTPAGRLGVLICADSWFPGPYEVLKRQGVELVAVPSYAAGDDHWDAPWAGYMEGTPPPSDVAGEDSGSLSSREAWLTHAMAGRLPSSGARAGINVFLRGCFWDLGADGHTIMALGEQVYEGEHVQGAALANLWL